MALTNLAASKAKPADKPYKLADEKGMYLLVSSAGKYWRMDYRHLGKRKTLAIAALCSSHPMYKIKGLCADVVTTQ